MIFLLSLLAVFQLNADNLSTRAFYSNLLYAEKSPYNGHINFEGFIENTKNHIDEKDKKDCEIKKVEYLLGKIHNVMLKTFYSCAADAPRAETFGDAIDGKHTPDSQHYASLIHSALSLKGIKTDFFRTPTHYGIHYEDQKSGEELYWCIITPLAMNGPARNKKEYAAMFNKYKNPEVNGTNKIKETDIKLISDDEFAEMNMSSKKL
ncbi:MAG: hypothetical protein NTY22_03150 [Proteobacteria bacterium]|nr:hypothetical protein [Pseudomonadota bacterium]